MMIKKVSDWFTSLQIGSSQAVLLAFFCVFFGYIWDSYRDAAYETLVGAVLALAGFYFAKRVAVKKIQNGNCIEIEKEKK